MVAQDERPLAQRGARDPGALDQVGVARRGQVAHALDAPLGREVAALPQQEQGGRAGLDETARACGALTAHGRQQGAPGAHGTIVAQRRGDGEGPPTADRRAQA
ncbi:Uncharacterised protein [Mycobacteroides abscessus]|nr:Uncharacterised protein [Mycobacteroides abscessus]